MVPSQLSAGLDAENFNNVDLTPLFIGRHATDFCNQIRYIQDPGNNNSNHEFSILKNSLLKLKRLPVAMAAETVLSA